VCQLRTHSFSRSGRFPLCVRWADSPNGTVPIAASFEQLCPSVASFPAHTGSELKAEVIAAPTVLRKIAQRRLLSPNNRYVFSQTNWTVVISLPWNISFCSAYVDSLPCILGCQLYERLIVTDRKFGSAVHRKRYVLYTKCWHGYDVLGYTAACRPVSFLRV